MRYDAGMPRKQIHDTLDTLHQQLRDAKDFDEADRQHLSEILQEIADALRADEVHADLGDRVKQSVATFETRHPTIATALHGILESLAKI